LKEDHVAKAAKTTARSAGKGTELREKVIKLLRQYQSKELGAKEKVSGAMRRLGDKLMPILHGLLLGEDEVSRADPVLRVQAGLMIYAFGKPGDRATAAVLARALGDADKRVRSITAQALPRVATTSEVIPDAAVENVVKALGASPVQSRYSSAMAVNMMAAIVKERAAGAVPALIETLAAKDWEVRCAAIASLSHVGVASRVAMAKLVRLAKEDRHPEVRRGAAIALTEIGADRKRVVAVLREAMKDKAAIVRQAAGERLEALGAGP
jgi:HEAT repeat protein